MRWEQFKAAIGNTVSDVDRNHTLTMAAALSYYFILALFPALIFLAGIVAYVPIPNLFDQALQLLARFVPADSMALIRRVLSDVISPNRRTLLSVGLLGTLWTASGGFVATIEALNIAYDVEETRPFWKTRLLGVALAFLLGLLLLTALAVTVVEPHFGEWLSARLHLSWLFAVAWPYIEWIVAVGFTFLAVELLYFLAPNAKQRFWGTLPGRHTGSWLLVTTLLWPGNLLSQVRAPQPDLWRRGGRNRPHDFSVLDGLRHACRRRVERRTRQSEQERAYRAARGTSDGHEARPCQLISNPVQTHPVSDGLMFLTSLGFFPGGRRTRIASPTRVCQQNRPRRAS